MRTFIVVITIALIISPALAQGETLADLLSDPNCVSACYLGIEPGVTTQMELETILNQRDISFTSERIGSGPLISYIFEPTPPSSHLDLNRPHVYVDVAGDTVDLITLFLDNVTVAQMISWFGAPDAIRRADGGIFLYFAKGIIFGVSRNAPDQVGTVLITRPGKDALRIAYTLDTSLCTVSTGNCSIPTATPTPTASPIVTITITVPPTDGAILATQDDTRFQAVAYDSAVGTNDGDGILQVDLEVYDPSGTLIYANNELQAAYCVFGGDGPCAVAPSGLLGLPGTYTLKARTETTPGTWTDWVVRTFVIGSPAERDCDSGGHCLRRERQQSR